MMKRLIVTAAAVTAVLATGSQAFAQAKPEDVIKFRKGAYSVTGWYMGQLGAMVKGQRPFDAAMFARNAAIIEQMSKVVPDAFEAGSDKGETRAKPEIWSQPDKFKAALTTFQSEATKLADAAKSGNEGAMKQQFGALAKACSNCHDNFRTK